jgi:hypothetical protein
MSIIFDWITERSKKYKPFSHASALLEQNFLPAFQIPENGQLDISVTPYTGSLFMRAMANLTQIIGGFIPSVNAHPQRAYAPTIYQPLIIFRFKSLANIY